MARKQRNRPGAEKRPVILGPAPTPKKIPATGRAQAPSAKIPAAVESRNYMAHSPAWRLSWLEMAEPFGWHRLEFQQVEMVLQRLCHLEKLSWNEILVRDKGDHHSIEISKLCKAARDRLVETKRDDIDEVVSLRVRGRERVFGILREGVFYLMWWDPDHEICPSLKKHT